MRFRARFCLVSALLLAYVSRAVAESSNMAAQFDVGHRPRSSPNAGTIVSTDASTAGGWTQVDVEFAQLQSTKRRLASAEVQPTGVWDEFAQIPADRTLGEVSAGILTLKDKPYMLVVGEAPFESDKTATLIYDITEDVWLIGSSRDFVGNHHASEVINNSMYLFGGLSSGHETIQIASLLKTPQGVDVEWTFGAELPVPSGSAATALIGGLVYYCGGINEDNTLTYDACYVYDPASDSWSNSSAVPPMPEGRNHAAACTDGEKMYVFGGRSGFNVVGKGFADTQILTPGEGWAEGTPLPLARGGMGKAVFYNGECYVFGGEVEEAVPPSPANKVSSTRTVYRVDVYSPATDSWREESEMPVGLHGLFPVLYKGFIHMAGGGIQAAYSQSTLHFRFSPAGDAPLEESAAAAPSPAGSTWTTSQPPVSAPMSAPATEPVPSSAVPPSAEPEAAARGLESPVAPPTSAATPRMHWGSVTGLAAPGSSPTGKLAGWRPGMLSLLQGLAFFGRVPWWMASVMVSVVSYSLCGPLV